MNGVTLASIAALVLGFGNALPAEAQSRSQSAPATAPRFEVVSVRPCGADNRDKGDIKGDGVESSPGRLHIACTTVLALIQQAYGAFANDRFNPFASVSISGAPGWIDSDRYQIDATADGPQGEGTMQGSMLRALLEDRFQLKTHRETREIPVYALTVAVSGAKLQPFKEGSCLTVDFSDPDHSPLPKLEPGQPFPLVCGMGRLSNSGYDLPGATMAAFCRDISFRLDRPVIDRTGIAGRFNIHLDLPSDPAAVSTSPTDPYSTFDAIGPIVRKLGLKLESSKGPSEVLVVDRVEKPSGN